MSDQTLLNPTDAAAQAAMTGQGFSNLMALASLDTSDMKAQISRLPFQGIYVEQLVKIGFTEQPPQDPAQPMNFNLNIQGLVLAFTPLDKEDTAAANAQLEGTNLSERFFVYGVQVQDAIQLLMGKYKIAGFRHKGQMGGVEGQAPGWIDEAVGKRIVRRVRHITDKSGQDRAVFDWLSPKQLEKIGVNWAEIMQRPFLDESGKEMDPNDLFGKKKAA